ncbi:hypothetical protein [Archaeoglobus veneficus]|uniref:DUF8098 domain-containing protein n=2 Tax=root TaxID=1 RepID=F2KMF7_ARCVS|nr:hypothetical protein [Archaeoglobus veneficus]AEA46056.1 hypothetical protein Arcve_0012 [Archaeoglobus veneficus SNP6]
MTLKSWETEREAVKLILALLDEQLSEMDFDKTYLNKVKVHKILYNTIEELDLDITRSWYKRGCFVWSCRGLDALFLQARFTLDMINPDIISIMPPKDEIIRAIKSSLQKYRILFRRLHAYLEELYEKDAPEEFREIYTSNLAFKERYKEFIEEARSKFGVSLETFLGEIAPPVTSEYVSSAITKLHLALSSVESVADVVIDYTMLFEELLIGVEEKLKKNELSPEHVDFIEKMFEYYDNKVWELPAKIITDKTIKGANKEVILKKLNAKFPNLVEEVEFKREEFETKALEMDLFPSESYLAERIDVNDAAKAYSRFMTKHTI